MFNDKCLGLGVPEITHMAYNTKYTILSNFFQCQSLRANETTNNILSCGVQHWIQTEYLVFTSRMKRTKHEQPSPAVMIDRLI